MRFAVPADSDDEDGHYIYQASDTSDDDSEYDTPPRSRSVKPKARGRLRDLLDIVDEAPTGYDAWRKITEQAVWREGHKIAHSRRAHLREVAMNARDSVKAQQDAEAAKEAEDMRMLLEGMSIQVAKDEEAARQVFKEREKKLWEDIDAAIARAEALAAEQAALAAAAEAKRIESQRQAAEAKDAAEKAAAEKAEAARKAAEQQAAEAKRQEALDAAKKSQEEAAALEAEELRQKEAKSAGRAKDEWTKWVGVQRWMKTTVIEPVKGDRETKGGLRASMRGITRGLGQVVNTREAIVRVTSEINEAITAVLPAAPTPREPASLGTITSIPSTLSTPPAGPSPLPLPYLYLLSHIAKCLIRQAGTEVSAKQDAAFPLARIVIGLLMRGHAALGDVLMARLVKKCPLVVPYYPSRQVGQSREDFDKSLGRQMDESPTEYVSRTTGICALYFSILSVPLLSFVAPPSSIAPHRTPTPMELPDLVPPALRLPAAWDWLAHALKAPIPSLLPAAQLLTTWIEICSFDVATTFGPDQVDKVMRAILREGVGEENGGHQGTGSGAVKGDSKAAVQRLAVAAREWRGRGKPEGRDWAL